MAAGAKVIKVLMCRPLHFNVDFVINPWMQPHSVDEALALQQWEVLVKKLESLDIKVEVIDQVEGVPDMVFATDEAIVRDGAALLANFRYPQRAREKQFYRKWFRDNGYRLRALSNVHYFEGGDALFCGDALYVGTGFRASVASCEELSKKLDTDVYPLRLTDPRFYHLDMAFFPISNSTAFYYPPVFSKNSLNLLRKTVPNLIEMSEEEAFNYCANSYISDKDVVVQSGSPSFEDKLEELGLTVHTVDMSEFKKAGGGIHCLINTLEVTN